jgi:hypothetical protein
MKLTLLSIGFGLALAAQAPVPRGARVYLHPIYGFGDYVHSAFREKGVPMDMVGQRARAEFELTGNGEREDAPRRRPKFLPVTLLRGREVINLRLQRVATGEVVFSQTHEISKATGGRRAAALAFAGALDEWIRRSVATPGTATAGGTALRITSAPSYGELEVDGVFWGVTPTVELTRLKPGPHVIVVKKPGFSRWERKVEIVDGESQVIHAELARGAQPGATGRIAGLE